MSDKLTSITREQLKLTEKGNMGGLAQGIIIIALDDVLVFPSVTGVKSLKTTEDFVVVNDGAHRIYHTVGTGQVRAEQQGPKGGRSFANRMAFEVPGNTPELSWLLSVAKNKRLVGIGKDRQGNWRIVGEKKRPAYLMVSEATGLGPAEKPLASFELMASSDTPALFFEGAIVDFPEPILSLFSATPANLSFTQSAGPDGVFLAIDGQQVLFSVLGKASFTAFDFDDADVSGPIDLSTGWTGLLSFSSKNNPFSTLVFGAWVNQNNVAIDIAGSVSDLPALLTALLTANGVATNTGRTLAVGTFEADYFGSVREDYEDLLAANWTISTIIFEILALTASNGAGIAVTKSGPAATIDIVGTSVRVFIADGIGTITQLLADNAGDPDDNAGISGTVDLTGFTNLSLVRIRNQNIVLIPGTWVQATGVTITVTNSILGNSRVYDLIRALLVANGGTYSDDGDNFTGTGGNNFTGRTLAIGTVVLDAFVPQDNITLGMIAALNALGWTITTIKTLCAKFIDFCVVDDSILSGGEIARYKIPKDYTIDRPALQPVITGADVSELNLDGAIWRLIDTDGTTVLFTGLFAINADLVANDRIDCFIEIEGTPLDGFARVILSIRDFPEMVSPCNSNQAIGIYGPTFLSLYQSNGITDNAGNVETWEDILNVSNFQFTQAIAGTRPVNSSGSLSFPNGDRFLEFTGVKSNFNFLHQITESYAITMCVDIPVVANQTRILHAFGNDANSANSAFSLAKTPTGSYRFVIFRGVLSTFVYNIESSESYSNQKNIVTIWVDNTQARFRIDAVQDGQQNRLNAPSAVDSFGNIRVGSGYTAASSQMRGTIHDIIIKKNPTLTEIQNAENYLAAKNNIII